MKTINKNIYKNLFNFIKKKQFLIEYKNKVVLEKQ
jgi:hypothetical protein